MSFFELSEQERIEALTSGINSTGLKAATLWVMSGNVAYTRSELATEVYDFLCSKPASIGIPYTYCLQSLGPIGMVVKLRLKDGEAVAFQKTKDGFVYGDPSIVRYLYAANELGISFNGMNGIASSPRGTHRHGYLVARILEFLRNGSEVSTVYLAKNIGMDRNVVGKALASLERSGLIEYDRIRVDSYGNSEKGYSIAFVHDKDMLIYYRRNPDDLRAAVLGVRPYFTQWSSLERVVSLEADSLEPNKIAEDAGIPHSTSHQIIGALVDLGIYRHGRFKGRERHSSAKINHLGEFLFDQVYGPIIGIAREPESRDARIAFNELIREVDINALFKEEIERYSSEKRTGDGSKTDSEVYKAVETCQARDGDLAYRNGDIISVLRASGRDMNPSTVHRALERLANRGELERMEGRPARYRIKA